MIQYGETLLSEEIFEEQFVCDLKACKGACCVEGDAGAPLTEEEVSLLEDNLEKIMPYLPKEGQDALKEQGAFVMGEQGELETTLVGGKECAYTVFEKNGTAKCGIEMAQKDGVVDFEKPISCHLYPIRISQVGDMEALNYSRWNICADACSLGKQLKVPVYKFLKDSLTRKYGEQWYAELEHVATALEEHNKNK